MTLHLSQTRGGRRLAGLDIRTVDGNPFVVLIRLTDDPINVEVLWVGRERESSFVLPADRETWIDVPEGADDLRVTASTDRASQSWRVTVSDILWQRKEAGVLEREPSRVAFEDPQLRRSIDALAEAMRSEAARRARWERAQRALEGKPEPPAVWKWPKWAQKMVRRVA